MTVIKSFQCDICFKPCGPQGNITIKLEQEKGTLHYHIVARESVLQDIKAPAGVMVRHICETCNNTISGGVDIPDPAPQAPAPWAPAADMEEGNNGQTD